MKVLLSTLWLVTLSQQWRIPWVWRYLVILKKQLQLTPATKMMTKMHVSQEHALQQLLWRLHDVFPALA
jgi:hypothetical protein